MPIIVFIPSPYLALSFYATPNPLPNRPALRTFQFAIPPCSSAHPFRGEAFHCPISNSAPSNAIQHLNLRVPHPSWFSAKDGLLPSDSSAPSSLLCELCVTVLLAFHLLQLVHLFPRHPPCLCIRRQHILHTLKLHSRCPPQHPLNHFRYPRKRQPLLQKRRHRHLIRRIQRAGPCPALLQ